MQEMQPNDPLDVGDHPREGDPDLPHGSHQHDEPGSQGNQPGDQPKDDVELPDTLVIVNGRAIDLAREPLMIEYQGFTLHLGFSPDKVRDRGKPYVEQYHGKEIIITGAIRGEPRLARPPGRLFINGKHIEYGYEPTTGRIDIDGMFSVHYSLVEAAHAYIDANPTLADIGHHHGQG